MGLILIIKTIIIILTVFILDNMKRTEAQITARLAAERKGKSLDRLTYLAISSRVFVKPGLNEDYSHSWVIDRLRRNDKKVAKKLVEFAATL